MTVCNRNVISSGIKDASFELEKSDFRY